MRDDGDVGEHTVVGRSTWVDLHHVQSIGVKMDSRLGGRNGLSMVERLDVGEVLGWKGSESGGVFVQKGDGVNRGTSGEYTFELSNGPSVVPG